MKRTIIFTAMLILAAFAAACGSGAKPTAENPVKGQVIKSGPIGTGMTVTLSSESGKLKNGQQDLNMAFTDADGTALIAAAHLGHDGVVRQLIAAGAPLDHVNNLHWTAVIESIVLGNGGPRHQATLKALIDAGANLQLTDRQGNTPLQLARSRGCGEMVKLLEKAAAK